MHKNREYLQSLSNELEEKNISESVIVEKGKIGSFLHGEDSDLIYRSGGISEEYDKALIAVVRDNKKIDLLKKLINEEPSLKWHNFNDKGFICAVPFQKVKHLDRRYDYEVKGELEMKICDYLTTKRIIMDLKADSRDSAINEMAHVLEGSSEIVDFKMFLKDVYNRENLQSTGVGLGVAIPHARTKAVDDFIIAFGRSDKGVDFNSIDKKPVNLIFLMGTPEKKKMSAYLKILSHLSRIIKKEGFRNKLMSASSQDDVIKLFEEVEL